MSTAKSETKVNTNSKMGKVQYLTEKVDHIKDANLKERIQYALDKAKTNLRKVTNNDLTDLISEVKDYFSEMTATVIENKVKTEPEEEEAVDEEVIVEAEDEAEEVKPKSKKTGKKKPTFHKSKKVETAPQETTNNKYLPVAKFFPETIENEDLGTLKAVPDKYHTYKELYDALEQGKTIYFACYWTKRHIKQYDYAGRSLVSAPKEFPNDLDLLVACVPCETIERVWCMSRYTEAMFFFEGYDLKPVEDTDPKTDEKFNIRVAEGMEFELYVPEDEA